MTLNELSDEQLIAIIIEARESNVLSDSTREVIANRYNKLINKVTLTDLVAFGWEVAEVLAERMNFYKGMARDLTIGNLP